MSGLEFVQGLANRTLPLNTIARTLGYDVIEVANGRVVIVAEPDDTLLNPAGTIHGGFSATLLDSCMGLAIQSTLDKGIGQTTLEFKISLVRPITTETGEIRAEGMVLSRGRRVGTAVAAIRFTVAGLLLLPYLAKKGPALDRLGWTGVAIIIAGCGAPMVLLVNMGLLFAPAAHAGALFPGVMPLMVAILAAMVLKEPFHIRKRIGFVLIVLGAVGIVWGRGGTIGTAQNIGHALFLLAGLAWAGYTVVMRHARLDGLHAAAIAAVGSLVLYLPFYIWFAGISVFKAPLFDIGLQAVVQGVLTAIVALLLYGRMVSLLGATGGAAFVALTPVVTGLMAIPVLGEWPMTIDWLAIVLISGGVYVVSGDTLPYWKGKPAVSFGQ